MTKLSNKTIALLAMLLLTTKAKAQEPTQVNDEAVYAALGEIQNQSDLLNSMKGMPRVQLENQLQLSLTDDEFNSVHALIAQMLNEGMDIQAVRPEMMMPGTQEYAR